jgi:bisphosphoglycerate-dependent phosphoglycerate mutase
MIQLFKVYKYITNKYYYVNGIAKSLKTGKNIIIFTDVNSKETQPLVEPEEEFEKNSKLYEIK